VEIRHADFLQPATEEYQYILGNPPYVSILGLTAPERLSYRASYRTARGRFDLYVLFFEQALHLLARNGRVVFITPEKFLYVETAEPLRALLQQYHVEEICFAPESTFTGFVTYPLISTVNATEHGTTRISRRNGTKAEVVLATSSSWQSTVEGYKGPSDHTMTLADITVRISCGVATGADSVFVVPAGQVPVDLRQFAHATISGRQIAPSRLIASTLSLLSPYDSTGYLLAEDRLGALGTYLSQPERRAKLEGRTCVVRKAWYAFHDNLPLTDMLRPKLLCKDITEEPFFVVDHGGTLVPRHSVYYIVPSPSVDLEALAAYLNSDTAREWLRAHCQRAANGFLRLQSHVLKRMPVPSGLWLGAEKSRATNLEELIPA
jgi:hypothetical protein